MSRKASLLLEKKSVNQLALESTTESLVKLVQRAIGKTFSDQGWDLKPFEIKHSATTDGHNYSASLVLFKTQERERDNSEQVFQSQLADVVRKILSAGRGVGWMAAALQPNEIIADLLKDKEIKQEFNIELPEAIASHFAHIFSRESQIRVVYDAIRAAVSSQFVTRNHCLLWGKPACGKTEILLAFEKLLGSQNCVKLDATMSTKAGCENLLLEMGTIPPILIIEEAEKVNPDNLSWLLGVLDQRGEIIKTNARIGSIRQEARCLCLATVNNLAEFQGIMAGALASRFAHKVYCPRPTNEILEMILRREVKKMGGRKEWVKPAIDYVTQVEGTSDPRRCIAVLDGRDRLLDGSYQADLKAIYDMMKADGMEPPPN